MKKILVLSFLIIAHESWADISCSIPASNGHPASILMAADANDCYNLQSSLATSDCLNRDGSECGPFGNLMQKCTSGVTSAAFCGMAVLAGVQIVTDLLGSKKSKDIADQVQCTGSYCSSTNNPPGYNFSNPGITNQPGLTPIQQGNLATAQKALQTLATKGYTYDPATNSVNTPNGAVGAGSYSSPSGLAAAGATPAQIASIEQALKAASHSTAIGYDEGGGGGSKPKGGGYPDASKSGFDMNAYMRALAGQNAKRSVAGLQVKAGTDNIGVAQDNIFQMVDRSYQVQASTLDQSN